MMIKSRKPWRKSLDDKYHRYYSDEEIFDLILRSPLISTEPRPLNRKLKEMQERGLVVIVATYGEGMTHRWAIAPRVEPVVTWSPFDWLVSLLCECYRHSRYAADFPTFDAYLADLYALEYAGDYVGPVAVYRSKHYVNEFSSWNWEHVSFPPDW